MPIKRSALIVDDDPHFRAILEHLLRPWNLRIVSSGLAVEAGSLIREPFDLYIIDLRLADGDAESLLRQLASQGTEIRDRCLVVTSYPMVASAFTDFRIVPKTKLTEMGPHLVRILGNPEPRR